jgi:hypothetical protein
MAAASSTADEGSGMGAKAMNSGDSMPVAKGVTVRPSGLISLISLVLDSAA